MSIGIGNQFGGMGRPLYAQRPPLIIHRPAAALPNNAQAPIFTVRGGQVRLLQLLADFEAAADATVTNLTLVANPSNGIADTNLHTAQAIASTAIGTLHAVTGAGIGVAPSRGGAVSGMNQPIIIDNGTIDALTNANNAAARVAYYALVEPLTAGASLTPVLAAGRGYSTIEQSPFYKFIKRRAAVVPQTAQAAIFRVTGGPILLWCLYGKVTTAFSAVATNLTVVGNPSSGVADVNLCTATAVTSLPASNPLSLQVAGIGSALATGGAAQSLLTPIIVDAGTIDLLTSASNPGAVEWTAIWQKLHPNGNLIIA